MFITLMTIIIGTVVIIFSILKNRIEVAQMESDNALDSISKQVDRMYVQERITEQQYEYLHDKIERTVEFIHDSFNYILYYRSVKAVVELYVEGGLSAVESLVGCKYSSAKIICEIEDKVQDIASRYLFIHVPRPVNNGIILWDFYSAIVRKQKNETQRSKINKVGRDRQLLDEIGGSISGKLLSMAK